MQARTELEALELEIGGAAVRLRDRAAARTRRNRNARVSKRYSSLRNAAYQVRRVRGNAVHGSDGLSPLRSPTARRTKLIGAVRCISTSFCAHEAKVKLCRRWLRVTRSRAFVAGSGRGNVFHGHRPNRLWRLGGLALDLRQ